MIDQNLDPREQILYLLGQYAEEEEQEFVVEIASMEMTRGVLDRIDPDDEDDDLEDSDFDWSKYKNDGFYLIERTPKDENITIHVRADPSVHYNDTITRKLGMWLDNLLDADVTYSKEELEINITLEGVTLFLFG